MARVFIGRLDPGTRNCDGRLELPSNRMNVAKGASGESCGVLCACGDAFLSIATSGAVRSVVDMMSDFGQDFTNINLLAVLGARPNRNPGKKSLHAGAFAPHQAEEFRSVEASRFLAVKSLQAPLNVG